MEKEKKSAWFEIVIFLTLLFGALSFWTKHPVFLICLVSVLLVAILIGTSEIK